MLGALVVLVVVLGGAALALVAVLLLPLLVIGLVVKALVALIVLPLRALGGIAAFALGAAKLVLGLVAACALHVALVHGGVVLLPLLPLLAHALTAWIVSRMARGARPAAR